MLSVLSLSLLACAPLSDNSNSPAKSPISLSATAVVSSVQLEMSSSLALTNIGAVIRLATEAAPTKVQAEANAGYVSLDIPAGGTRKFSISQHYGSDFTNGLTLADVLAANTDYKLYLFFEANTIPAGAIIAGATIEEATIANDTAALSFTTAALPPAGDDAWARSQTEEQFVGSLSEWNYNENQKGVFVAYVQLPNNFNTFTLTTRTGEGKEKKLNQTLGTLAVGSFSSDPSFLSDTYKLGGSYPDAGNYYGIIGTEKNQPISGTAFQLEVVAGLQTVKYQVPLNRYSNP
ncbi:hypothetical protein P0082_02420 [Candidatus Haliotispira prima]|uniref:Uncharacterized protein n=1 Tax=Candidatus Haliotispira prima TaxID=3034016 RepID=A0ABY8MIM3_9SPIO|nr:hypothetical protein P0082_02420 [Candidatus Haliotispira prima]